MDKSKGELMLKRTKIGIFAAFLVTTGVVHAEDSNSSADWNTVVANVNGEDITVGHMVVARGTLSPEYLALDDQVLFEGILENLIQQTLLSQSVAGDISKYDQLVIENDARAYLAGTVVSKILTAPVDEDALQALFDERYVQAEAEEEFNGAHILVETKEEADLIVKLLEEGSEFAALAREKSTAPSGPNGGNLGWFIKGKMVPEFEAAIITLEDGAYSAPVQTQYGWHVIHRIEGRMQDVPELALVRDALVAEMSRTNLTEAVESLTEAAEIKYPEGEDIDPMLLKSLSETGQ